MSEKKKAIKLTVTEDMFNLAGLQKIEYVFFYPETGDIVIAGPAEGWTLGSDGAVVGFNIVDSWPIYSSSFVAVAAYVRDACNSSSS